MKLRRTAAASVVAAALAMNGCAGGSPATPLSSTPPSASSSEAPIATATPTALATETIAPTPGSTIPAAGIGASWTWRPAGLNPAAAVGSAEGWILVGGAAPLADPSAEHDVPAAWTSSDGGTWHRADVELPQGVQRGSLELVAGEPGGFAAAGSISGSAVDQNRFAVWSSVDGRSWGLVAAGPLLDLGPCISGCASLRSIATNGTIVVVTGYRVTPNGDLEVDAWTGSSHGQWQRTAFPAAETGSRVAAETSVVASADGFLVAGSVCDAEGMDCRAVTWASTNGFEWSRPSELPGGAGCGTLRIVRGVVDAVVVLGQRCVDGCRFRAWSSPDGASWVKGDLELAKVRSPERGLLAFAGGRFLAIGSRAGVVEVWSSADGTTWREVTLAAPFPPREELLFHDLAGRPEGALAIGAGPGEANGVWTSP